MGAGSDLQIFHDGSNSYIRDTGTGVLVIDTDGTTIDLKGSSPTEYMARFVKDGAVSLYYDNAAKLATASAGVTVTGTLTATAFAGDGSALTGVAASTTVGDVGTYAMLYEDGDNKAARSPGDDVTAGSTLAYAGIKAVGTGNVLSQGTYPAGTWRLMGSYNTATSTNDDPISLWLRIS